MQSTNISMNEIQSHKAESSKNAIEEQKWNSLNFGSLFKNTLSQFTGKKKSEDKIKNN